MPERVDTGTWVEIHSIVLAAGERAPQVPADTAAVPLEMRVKGFLCAAGAPGDRVNIVTAAGRSLTGTLAEVFAGAEARQHGLAGKIEAVAVALGCGFVDAGEHVQVSDIDGVHWDQDQHALFGQAMARVASGQLARLE